MQKPIYDGSQAISRIQLHLDLQTRLACVRRQRFRSRGLLGAGAFSGLVELPQLALPASGHAEKFSHQLDCLGLRVRLQNRQSAHHFLCLGKRLVRNDDIAVRLPHPRTQRARQARLRGHQRAGTSQSTGPYGPSPLAKEEYSFPCSRTCSRISCSFLLEFSDAAISFPFFSCQVSDSIGS